MDFNVWLLSNLNGHFKLSSTNVEANIIFAVVRWKLWMNRNVFIFQRARVGVDQFVIAAECYALHVSVGGALRRRTVVCLW